MCVAVAASMTGEMAAICQHVCLAILMKFCLPRSWNSRHAVTNPAVTNSAWFVCHDKPLNQQIMHCSLRLAPRRCMNHLTSIVLYLVLVFILWTSQPMCNSLALSLKILRIIPGSSTPVRLPLFRLLQFRQLMFHLVIF